MKKIPAALCLCLILMIASPAEAKTCPVVGKLTRGVVTVLTSPLEIPKQARIYWKEGAKKIPHVLVWIFCGAVKGMVNMVVRVASGTWDIVTLPIPIPTDYKPLVKTKAL